MNASLQRLNTGAPKPRAISGLVRGEGNSIVELVQGITASVADLKAEQKHAYANLQKTFEDFKAANDQELKELKAGRADTVTTEHVSKLSAAMDDSVDKVKEALATIKAYEKDIDGLSRKIDAMKSSSETADGRDARAYNEHMPEYRKAFAAYFRKGENAIQGGEAALHALEVKAALTTNSNPDGGFTVTPEMETQIDEVLREISPMRSVATVRPIGSSAYKKLVNKHGTASGWVGETDARPQTIGPQLSELEFPTQEVFAMPAASQAILDDSYIDIGQWLASEIELEFAAQEGLAFIAGDGTKKPRGIIGGYPVVADANYQWGKLGYVATAANGAFASTSPADSLVDLYHAPKSPYRTNSTWLMNRKTLGAVRKLKDGQGNYLVNLSFRSDGPVLEILGRPVVEMPDMPDIAINSLSIAFGDFRRGYIIIDRLGVRVLRDPYTSKPYVLFYTTKRVGGGVQNFEAIKLLKFSAN